MKILAFLSKKAFIPDNIISFGCIEESSCIILFGLEVMDYVDGFTLSRFVPKPEL